MYTQRFGRKLKLPATAAIKHGIMKLMLQDHLKAEALNASVVEAVDPAGPAVAAVPPIK